MTPERVIEVAIGLYEGPRLGADAPPGMARAVMAALAEHGMAIVPAEDATRCFRLDHEGRLGHAEETARAAQDTIARVDALHRPRETRLTTLCIDHNSIAHVRTVSVTDVEECRRCQKRPALTCSNITCCQWPCAVHLALHDETEETCAHG